MHSIELSRGMEVERLVFTVHPSSDKDKCAVQLQERLDVIHADIMLTAHP